MFSKSCYVFLQFSGIKYNFNFIQANKFYIEFEAKKNI